jgi:hypothetical protein
MSDGDFVWHIPAIGRPMRASTKRELEYIRHKIVRTDCFPNYSIGALPNARSRNAAFPTLEENFNGVQDVLRSEGATEMTVLEKRNADFLQKPALFTKIRYKEAVSGITWIEESIDFKTEDEILYSMELKARPEELSELEPIFNVMVYNTFRMNCASQSRRRRK